MPHIPFIVSKQADSTGSFFIAKLDTKRLHRLKDKDFDTLSKIMKSYGAEYYYKSFGGFKFKHEPPAAIYEINFDLQETYRGRGRPRKMEKGGLIEGKSHANGGVKAVIKDTETPIEVEGGEVIINKNTVQSEKKFSFQNKTAKEILSELNQAGGGVPIYKKGGKITKEEITKEAKEHIQTFEKIARKQIKTPSDLGKSIVRDHNNRKYAIGGRFSENILKYNSIPREVKEFMPPMQAKVVYSALEEFQQVIDDLLNQIKSLPKPYGTEGTKTEQKIAWLHYFYGSNDWYIIENDSSAEKLQCFGWAILNNDYQNAEFGYINVEELKATNKVELDFYWTPKPIGDIIELHNPEVKTIDQSTQSETDLSLNKNHEQITIEIRDIINRNGLDYSEYTPAELQYLRKYEGLGGLAQSTYIKNLGIDEKTNILDQFFTPDIVIKYMWALAVKYGFDFSRVNNILEPSVGIGRFLEYIPDNQNVDAFDIDYYSYVICKLSFPKFNIKHASIETLFFQGRRRVGLSNITKRYDLVIGNPPYREYISEYSSIKGGISSDNKSEKETTLAHTFDQYMIARGVDLLKPGGLLVFIIPNSFLANDNKYNEFKEKLSEKSELLTAYRLPNGVFDNTEVGTDIIVLQRK